MCGNNRTSNNHNRTSKIMESERKSEGFKKPFKNNFFNNQPKPENKDIVFGIQSVLETLRSGKEIDKILVQRELGSLEVMEFARIRNIPVQKVPTEKLDRITRKNHQGVIAFVSVINYAKLENIVADVYEKGQVPLILIDRKSVV